MHEIVGKIVNLHQKGVFYGKRHTNANNGNSN